MPEVPQLGERGGGWVALQFVAMASVLAVGLVAPGWPASLSTPLRVASGAVALAGVALAVASARALASALTPFPRPAAEGALVESGAYRLVRHPIYLGGLLFFAGFSLAFSPWALAATGVLALVWALKLRVEEAFLEARFPRYADYRRRTRFRLVPFVY